MSSRGYRVKKIAKPIYLEKLTFNFFHFLSSRTKKYKKNKNGMVYMKEIVEFINGI